MTAIPRTPDSVEVIQVIKTKTLRGVGTTDDPARIVTQYWSLDGNMLADDDTHLEDRLRKLLREVILIIKRAPASNKEYLPVLKKIEKELDE